MAGNGPIRVEQIEAVVPPLVAGAAGERALALAIAIGHHGAENLPRR